MPSTKEYREVERKYLLRENEVADIPSWLFTGSVQPVEQYYLNHHSEPYELRMRKIQLDDGLAAHLATIKKGHPPDRLEMETVISPSTYERWVSTKTTEILQKTRQTVAFAAGHWALDRFKDIDLTILEAEGIVPLPDFGCDVTDDIGYTNYHLSQVSDAEVDIVSDVRKEPTTDEVELIHLRSLVEHRRQRIDRPIIIGICGATASGKTTVAGELAAPYGDQAVVIAQDDYYHGVDKMRAIHGHGYEVNFDEPAALNSPLLATHLRQLRAEKPVERPTYSMVTSNPTGEFTVVDPDKTPIIFVEGIHALDPELQNLYDLSIYVDAPLATRVGRRLERDHAEGRSYKPEDNLRYLLEVAEPTYQPYVASQKIAAEVIYTT